MFEHRKKPSEQRGSTRVCCACKTDKPLSEFFWHKGNAGCPDGWPSGRCKTCASAALVLYRLTRKRQYCEYAKNQRRKNPEKTRAKDRRLNQRRKLRIKNALTKKSNLVTPEWFRARVVSQKFKCYYCFDQMIPAFHEHVIPVSRGGKHVCENIVAACGSCNSSKNDKLIYEWRPWVDIPLYGLELATG